MYFKTGTVLVCAVVLLRCAVGPDFVPPAAPDTHRYTTTALPAETATARVNGGKVQRFKMGAMIFISLGVGGASLNIYTQVGLVTLIGLISKHGILIVQFANDLQRDGKPKREAVESAAAIRLRPILMTTAAMVLGALPLVLATGAGAVGRFNMGLVIMTGLSIGTLFTLFVVPAMYMLLAEDHAQRRESEETTATEPVAD